MRCYSVWDFIKCQRRWTTAMPRPVVFSSLSLVSEGRVDFYLLSFKRIFTSLLAAIERKMLNKNMNEKKNAD